MNDSHLDSSALVPQLAAHPATAGSAFVAALTWVMKDSLGEELDVLTDPVEFLVGGEDLLASIEQALQAKSRAELVGTKIKLYIEPEQGFGDFNEALIFLIQRDTLPKDFAKDVAVGMRLEAMMVKVLLPDAPSDALYTVSDVYPQHIVVDGNHPLAGISLDLEITVHAVREATVREVGSGSAGVRFF